MPIFLKIDATIRLNLATALTVEFMESKGFRFYWGAGDCSGAIAPIGGIHIETSYYIPNDLVVDVYPAHPQYTRILKWWDEIG